MPLRPRDRSPHRRVSNGDYLSMIDYASCSYCAGWPASEPEELIMKRLASAAAMAVAATGLALTAAPANAAGSITTRAACTKGGGHVVQKRFAGGRINVCSGGKEKGKIVSG